MLECWEDQFIHLFFKPFASVCFLPVPTLGAGDPAKRGHNPFPRGPLRSGNTRLESGITIRGPEEPSKGCRNPEGDITVGRGRQRSISRWCICWVFNNVYEFSRKRKRRVYSRCWEWNGQNSGDLTEHTSLRGDEKDNRHQHSWEGWMSG